MSSLSATKASLQSSKFVLLNLTPFTLQLAPVVAVTLVNSADPDSSVASSLDMMLSVARPTLISV
jgi:hypothetical protein